MINIVKKLLVLGCSGGIYGLQHFMRALNAGPFLLQFQQQNCVGSRLKLHVEVLINAGKGSIGSFVLQPLEIHPGGVDPKD